MLLQVSSSLMKTQGYLSIYITYIDGTHYYTLIAISLLSRCTTSIPINIYIRSHQLLISIVGVIS